MIASWRRTTTCPTMNKAEEEPLPPYTHTPTPQATKRNKRFWILVVLTGMLVFAVNFHGVLKTTSWRPHMGCGRGRLHTRPRSHYTLSSGDKIPSVALGEPHSVCCFDGSYLLISVTGVWKAGKGEVGQAVKAALAAGYRHIDDAWAYRVCTSTFARGTH